MSVGNNIRTIRMLRGMTQKELGLKAGFSSSTADVRIRQYESEKMVPKEDKLNDIAKALDVDVSALEDHNIASDNDVMHIFFELEDNYGLKIGRRDDGKAILYFDEKHALGRFHDALLDHWCRIQSSLDADTGDSDYQEKRKKYDLWKCRYPLDMYEEEDATQNAITEYGSVAEYNRSRTERWETEYQYEPSMKEALEEEIKREIWEEQSDALDVQPSEFALKAKEALEKKIKGLEGMTRIYTYCDEEYKTMCSIAEYHGIVPVECGHSMESDTEKKIRPYTETEPGKFTIELEKNKYGSITRYCLPNLDKDQFIQLHSDICHINWSHQTVYYMPEGSEKANYISNNSISKLRKYEFERWGVPMEQEKEILAQVERDVRNKYKSAYNTEKEQDKEKDDMQPSLNRKRRGR